MRSRSANTQGDSGEIKGRQIIGPKN